MVKLAAILVLPTMAAACGIVGEGGSKIAKGKSDVAALANALDTYRLDTGRYPSTKEGLQALLVAPARAQGWQGPYIKEVRDPWGKPYLYESPGPRGGETYVVRTYGADGRPGGEGKDADVSEEGGSVKSKAGAS